jgi:hypothetical protein
MIETQTTSEPANREESPLRIGLINVTKLAAVRRTFRIGWRIFISITFLLWIYLWWMAIHRVPNLTYVVTDDRVRPRTIIGAAVLLPVLIVVFFRRGDFARLTFALMSVFITLSILPFYLLAIYKLATTPRLDQGERTFALAFVLLMVIIGWKYLIYPSYVLLLSLTPFTRLKVYRRQVVHSLRLWSGRWKSLEAPQSSERGERLHIISGARYRLALGILFCILGLVCMLLTVIGFGNERLLPAIYHFEFIKAWQLPWRFQLPPPLASWQLIGAHVLNATVMLFIGGFCSYVFGYFWTQWQRENMLIFRTPISKHIAPSESLLLRSLLDDVKFVPRDTNVLRLPFATYQWIFTFEQMLVDRLSYLGKVRLLDIDRKNTWLLDKWRSTVFARLLPPDALKWFLISVFPLLWYKLPARGGYRHYIETHGDEKEWQEDVKKAMPIARMIVVVLGTTKSLEWEMEQIAELRFLEKTIFVMPPFTSRKKYRMRWEKLTTYLNEARGYDIAALKKVKPRHVLAVCVRQNTLVVVTGRSSQLFYEAALDVTTLFTVAEPESASQMIRKYLV